MPRSVKLASALRSREGVGAAWSRPKQSDLVTGKGSSAGTVNLSGRGSRMQATGSWHWVHCKPIRQISAQTRNFWVLEALCSAAVP